MRLVPPEVLPPIIQKQDPDADPIITLVLSGKSTSLRTLTEIADKQVKRSLEAVDGVGAVSISGDRPREIHIVVTSRNRTHAVCRSIRCATPFRGERRDTRRHALNRASGKSTCARWDASMPPRSSTTSSSPQWPAPVRIRDIGYAEDSVQRVLTSLT